MTRDQRLHRKDENEQQRGGDADQNHREYVARHPADRLAGKMRHPARHQKRDRQHIEAFEHGDAAASARLELEAKRR